MKPCRRRSTTLRPRSRAGRRLLLKREDPHELGAFKWRGALPSLERYRDQGAERGGHRLDRQPRRGHRVGGRADGPARGRVRARPGAARRSWTCSSELGAEVRHAGRRRGRGQGPRPRARGRARRLPFFEDGAEPAQFDGYAAIGREIVEQLGERPALTVVPVGNGALLIGVARGLGGGAVGVVRRRRR